MTTKFCRSGPIASRRRRFPPVGNLLWIVPTLAVVGVSAAGAAGRAGVQKTNKSTGSSPAQAGLGLRILVFPPDTKSGPASELSDIISSVEQDRLHLSRKYDSVLFLRSLPLVRRALLEQTLSASEVNPPYDNDVKLKKLARLAGYDRALVSSVADYQYDADKHQVSLVLTARIVDFSGPKLAIRAAAESGSTPAKSVQNESDTAAATQLARNLTDRIMTDLLKPAAPAPTTPPASDQKPTSPAK